MPEVVAQRLAPLGRRAQLGGDRVRGVAMPLQQPHRGVPARARPGCGQLGHLGALHPQRFGGDHARRPQLRTIAVERAQVETVLARIPFADLCGMRCQIGVLVAQRVAGLHVGLGVLDGGPALGEAAIHVQPVGHELGDPRRGIQFGVSVTLGAGPQDGGDFGRRARPLRHLRH